MTNASIPADATVVAPLGVATAAEASSIVAAYEPTRPLVVVPAGRPYREAELAGLRVVVLGPPSGLQGLIQILLLARDLRRRVRSSGRSIGLLIDGARLAPYESAVKLAAWGLGHERSCPLHRAPIAFMPTYARQSEPPCGWPRPTHTGMRMPEGGDHLLAKFGRRPKRQNQYARWPMCGPTSLSCSRPNRVVRVPIRRGWSAACWTMEFPWFVRRPVRSLREGDEPMLSGLRSPIVGSATCT